LLEYTGVSRISHHAFVYYEMLVRILHCREVPSHFVGQPPNFGQWVKGGRGLVSDDGVLVVDVDAADDGQETIARHGP
jgi:hypothetical protein